MAGYPSRRPVHIALIALSVLASIFLVYFVVSGHWQILTSNLQYANDTISLREPIVRSIESFHARTGHYPRHIDDIVHDLTPAVRKELDSSPFPASDWWYVYLSDDDNRLVTTTCHFVSSFDAVVYQRSKNYPGEWHFGNMSYPIRAGYYLIGAQERMELGEPLFPGS